MARETPVHVWTAGAAPAPAVVFIHGAGTDHHMFDRQIPAVLAAGFRTVRWDVGGHGLSKPMPRSFTIPDAAADLATVLDQLDVQQVHLVGQSMGGNIAQEFVRTSPGRVSGMVVIGSACHTLPVSRTSRWVLRASNAVFVLWPYKQLKHAMTRGGAVSTQGQRYLADVFDSMDRGDFLHVWRAMTRCLDPDPAHRVPAPLLLILGEKDATGDVAGTMRAWADRDRAPLHVIPGAGHVANIDRSEEVNRLMIDFLLTLDGREER
ncbi:MAG: 3-oxoadipate enol-lactonase [Actinomycetota bacterium]|nr:3-oxoadipate enol-lactonase [Actinomycetota bacterium]